MGESKTFSRRALLTGAAVGVGAAALGSRCGEPIEEVPKRLNPETVERINTEAMAAKRQLPEPKASSKNEIGRDRLQSSIANQLGQLGMREVIFPSGGWLGPHEVTPEEGLMVRTSPITSSENNIKMRLKKGSIIPSLVAEFTINESGKKMHWAVLSSKAMAESIKDKKVYISGHINIDFDSNILNPSDANDRLLFACTQEGDQLYLKPTDR